MQCISLIVLWSTHCARTLLLGKACTRLVGRDKGSINDAGSGGTELLVPLQLCPYSTAVSLQLKINL